MCVNLKKIHTNKTLRDHLGLQKYIRPGKLHGKHLATVINHNFNPAKKNIMHDA